MPSGSARSPSLGGRRKSAGELQVTNLGPNNGTPNPGTLTLILTANDHDLLNIRL